MSLIVTDMKNVQPGDHIILTSQILTVKAINGPDHIGTYDVFCLNSSGIQSQEIACGSVTIIT